MVRKTNFVVKINDLRALQRMNSQVYHKLFNVKSLDQIDIERNPNLNFSFLKPKTAIRDSFTQICIHLQSDIDFSPYVRI